MASKKKKETIFSRLIAKGVPEDLLQKVYAPIGLISNIFTETPEEIAVGILVEIMKTRVESHN